MTAFFAGLSAPVIRRQLASGPAMLIFPLLVAVAAATASFSSGIRSMHTEG